MNPWNHPRRLRLVWNPSLSGLSDVPCLGRRNVLMRKIHVRRPPSVWHHLHSAGDTDVQFSPSLGNRVMTLPGSPRVLQNWGPVCRQRAASPICQPTSSNTPLVIPRHSLGPNHLTWGLLSSHSVGSFLNLPKYFLKPSYEPMKHRHSIYRKRDANCLL